MSVSVGSCWCFVIVSVRQSHLCYWLLSPFPFTVFHSYQVHSRGGQSAQKWGWQSIRSSQSWQITTRVPIQAKLPMHASFPFNNTVYSNVPSSVWRENWCFHFHKWLSSHHSPWSSLQYRDQRNPVKATWKTRLICEGAGNEIFTKKLISYVLPDFK